MPGIGAIGTYSIGGVLILDEYIGKYFSEYSHVYPFQLEKIEREKREALKREKTDLERIDSVIKENERLQALAAESKLIAKEQRAIELAQKEQEYLLEINRLLTVRAELIRRIRKNEQFIIAVVLMKKRRLRVLH